MTEVTEQDLARTLKTVATATTVASSWEAVVADAKEAPDHPPFAAGRFLGVAAALLALVCVVFLYTNGGINQSLEVIDESRYLLPGETIVGVDPLTVLPAPSPGPRFDTSTLGTEIVIEPVRELDNDTRRLVSTSVDSVPGRFATKIVLLGRIDGEPYVDLISDGQAPPTGLRPTSGSSNYRERFVLGRSTSGSQTGGSVPSDSEAFIEAAVSTPTASPSYTTPGRGLIWSVGPETSVVTFATGETRLWTVPSGGHAILPVSFHNGQRFTLQALDAEGLVIEEVTQVVLHGSGSVLSPRVGTEFELIEGRSPDGGMVRIEPNGEYSVLLFGADWCPSCQTFTDRSANVVADLSPGIQVYLVPGWGYDGDTWIPGTNWLQPRIQLSTDIGAVQQLPAVIVLDGTNTIVAYETGIDEVENALRRLSESIGE